MVDYKFEDPRLVRIALDPGQNSSSAMAAIIRAANEWGYAIQTPQAPGKTRLSLSPLPLLNSRTYSPFQVQTEGEGKIAIVSSNGELPTDVVVGIVMQAFPGIAEAPAISD